MLLTISLKGEDGMTPWHRVRGRNFGLKLYAFGEQVFWKQPNKGPQHDVEGNMGPRMRPGIFVGYHRATNQYRVATADGYIMKSRALQSRLLEDRWSPELLKSIVSTPWNLRTPAAATPIDMGPAVEKHSEEPQVPPAPRRLKSLCTSALTKPSRKARRS